MLSPSELKNSFLVSFNSLSATEKNVIMDVALELYPITSVQLSYICSSVTSGKMSSYRLGDYRLRLCNESRHSFYSFQYVAKPFYFMGSLLSLGVKKVRILINERKAAIGKAYNKKQENIVRDDFLLALTEYLCEGKVPNTKDLGNVPDVSPSENTPLFEYIVFMMMYSEFFDPFLKKVNCENIPVKSVQGFIDRMQDMKEPSSVMLKRIITYRGGAGSSRIKGILNNYTFYNDFCLNGDIDAFEKKFLPTSLQYRMIRAMKYLAQGEAHQAVNAIEKANGSKMVYHSDSVYSLIYMMALYADDPKKNNFKKLSDIIKTTEGKPEYASSWLFANMALDKDVNNWISSKFWEQTVMDGGYALYLVTLFFGLDENLSKERRAEKEYELKNSSFAILRYLYAWLRGTDEEKFIASEQMGIGNIWPEKRKSRLWETKLLEIEALCESQKGKYVKDMNGRSRRIVYLVDIKTLRVIPVMQTSKDDTTWTKGRTIALKNFRGSMPEQTTQDLRVSKLVRQDRYYSSSYELAGAAVFLELVGHPYVFREDNPDVKVDIVSEPPQFAIIRTPKGFKVKCSIKNIQSKLSGCFVVEESTQRFNVIELTDLQVQVIRLLTDIKELPFEAEDKLKSVLGLLGAQVTVMSELLADVAEPSETIEGDNSIVAQLMPVDEDVRMRLYVKPFTDKPPYCNPGEGLEYVAANIDGKQTHAKRNLRKEKKNLSQLRLCLEPFEMYEDQDNWRLPPEECLRVLSILQQMKDICRAEWPEGVKYKVKQFVLTSKDINYTINGYGKWFEIDGSVNVGEDIKLGLAEMLDLIHDRRTGNFIQMGDNEFLELSAGLRKQLQQLDTLVPTKGKDKMRLSPFSIIALGNLGAGGAKVEADKEYKSLMKRIEDSATQIFKIPKKIQADLRDYQKEAYDWMSRLAYWGAGALLADDMGLGKTVEAITLMLSRAKDGPQLVVAPTSVILNWKSEITRFAPSLTPLVLNTLGTDRESMVKEAGKNDVVITSYGILVTEEELLSGKKWNTIVLDEAHTIKNRNTKMSKAAMQLEGDFRLLLTGTPLQNHLSEMWNLFEFANPGLLGSFNSFADNFIVPVEKNHDKDQQKLLKKIVQPFILRRTKTEVLSQLPQKTEITLKVQLSQEEWAFYDTIRENALIALKSGESNQMQTLAEITRLRQAACNVRLLEPKLPIESSKTEALLNLVDELTANHHRALVFSQFTSHLALIKEQLDKRKIQYEYLDGSTTPNMRARLVKKFQTGDAPLFLISLKAGGLGLNLTAADYVIHLDPWWNPAIEDQASDRAYRIGQDKPVTVYRIIAADTIEEKILELHKTKKSMADALLEGSDIVTTMTKEDMMQLLTLSSMD